MMMMMMMMMMTTMMVMMTMMMMMMMAKGAVKVRGQPQETDFPGFVPPVASPSPFSPFYQSYINFLGHLWHQLFQAEKIPSYILPIFIQSSLDWQVTLNLTIFISVHLWDRGQTFILKLKFYFNSLKFCFGEILQFLLDEVFFIHNKCRHPTSLSNVHSLAH